MVFFVHGGAWFSGDKADYAPVADAIVGHYGYTMVVINYRLSPTYKHPAHVQDVAKAYRWVWDHIGNAPYNANHLKVFPWGHSAGGHLVALLSTDESYLQAQSLSTSNLPGTIAYSGAYNLSTLPLWWKPILLAAFGTIRPSKLWDASPAKYIDNSQPPFLIGRAGSDLLALYDQAQALYNDLTSHGTSAQLETFSGYDHTTEIERIPAEIDGGPTITPLVTFVSSH